MLLMVMDVVFVVREGENNEALRYSLRSLRNFPHDKVYIAGYCPSWVQNVVPIYRPQDHRTDQENSNANLQRAAQDLNLSDNFVFMNDDFFIMEPVKEIPVMHQGSLVERINAYKSDNRYHQAYSLIRSMRYLESVGLTELLSYELHMPMVFNKYKVHQMFRDYPYPLFAMRPRTVYGNSNHISGELTSDAKDSSNHNARFVSSGFGFESNGQWIRDRFPDPSPYEQVNDESGVRPAVRQSRQQSVR